MKDFIRTLIIGIIVLGIIVALYFIFFSDKPIFLTKKKQYSDEQLIEMAQELFKEKKAAGMDMSNGPCIANELDPYWVVDVAHNPRQPIDDLPENQCSAFREGKAKHFIELDIEGSLIKIK